MVRLDDIRASQARRGGRIAVTPLARSEALSRLAGSEVVLKREYRQHTGSFKLRGAANAAARLGAVAGVTTASTGNHGRALAHAARARGLRAVIWARDPDRAQALADALTGADCTVTASADPAEGAGLADIIVTTTPATRPILRADWLRPGQHVTAMGSDQPGKAELEPACMSRADLYVADRLAQTRLMGELRAAPHRHDRDHPELGQIIAGQRPGRTDPGQITICELTGTGVQDTAIATNALAAFSEDPPDA